MSQTEEQAVPGQPAATAVEPVPPSLGAAARRGVAWLATLRVSGRLLTAVQLLVFARVAGQASTGIIGMALATLAAIETFSQLGIRGALIQRTGDIREHLPTAFTVQAVRGLVIAAVVWLTAGAVAAWFREPALVPVLQAFAVIPFLRGAANIAAVELERDLRFGRVVMLEVGTPVVDLLVTLLCLWISPGVFALVWGKIAGAAWLLAVSYLFVPIVCRPGWSWRRFLELNEFGRWLLVSGIITLIVTRGTDFIAGRVLTTEDMGVYTLATMLAVMPLLELHGVVGRVLFPTYSRIQADRPRLQRAFLRSFLVCCTVIVGSALLVAVAAPDLVRLTMSGSWTKLGVLVPLLVIWGACRAIGGATSSIFQATGHPAQSSYAHLIMLVLLAATVYPAAHRFGLVGICAALAATGLVAQACRYVILARILGVPAGSLYARTFVPFGVAGVAWGAASLLGSATAGVPPLARLILLPAAAAAVYAAGLAVWERVGKVPVAETLLGVLPLRLRGLISAPRELWSSM